MGVCIGRGQQHLLSPAQSWPDARVGERGGGVRCRICIICMYCIVLSDPPCRTVMLCRVHKGPPPPPLPNPHLIPFRVPLAHRVLDREAVRRERLR